MRLGQNIIAIILSAIVISSLTFFTIISTAKIAISEDTAHLIVLGHDFEYDYTFVNDSPNKK